MIIYIFDGISFLTSWRGNFVLERYRHNVKNIYFLTSKTSNLLYVLKKFKTFK